MEYDMSRLRNDLEGRAAMVHYKDLADEITYYSHDLDDAVDFEILTAAQLGENGMCP